jgi:hypothetical protein
VDTNPARIQDLPSLMCQFGSCEINLQSLFDLASAGAVLSRNTYLLVNATTAILIVSLFGGSMLQAQRSSITL